MCGTRLSGGGFLVLMAPILLCGSAVLGAGPVISTSTGSDMLGGFVTCTFFGGPMFTAPIVPFGSNGCMATSPGDFIFTIAPGDTFVQDWTLTNLQAARRMCYRCHII